MEHASPQVSEAQGIRVALDDAELVTVTVVPVTEHPRVVVVDTGEQVVVENADPSDVVVVGTHETVTCNAVSMDVQDKDELDLVFLELPVDESDFVFVFELFSSPSTVRFSFSDLRSSKVPSILSISPAFTLSVMLSKFLSMHDNVFTKLPKTPNDSLFSFFEPHGADDESLPRSEMRASTSLLIPFTLFRVSVFSGVGCAFQELTTGIRPRIRDDTENTADVA